MWKFFVIPSQFFCESKTSIKQSPIKKLFKMFQLLLLLMSLSFNEILLDTAHNILESPTNVIVFIIIFILILGTQNSTCKGTEIQGGEEDGRQNPNHLKSFVLTKMSCRLRPCNLPYKAFAVPSTWSNLHCPFIPPFLVTFNSSFRS